ncbi:type II toxin-antitoxin system VapC family toxin [uncultured Maricaulis sp.]|uniref:type II toxin-antitoxin system VapC family toxin n=1 Tax=uncultured Maricaulis sp. TaxID=174710 RepID=UPI0030D83580|tara:strand:- start:36263 stop:36688 length:426 start_codon:yes stop_codon:yes gene_type:complete
MSEANPALLLDTCAVIWISNGDPISTEALDCLKAAEARPGSVWISTISAWEVATLVARDRLSLSMPVGAWFEALTSLPQITIAPLRPDLLINSTGLPGQPPADPADRMIIATARQHGLTILTRDREILGYAARGHVSAMAC